MVASNGKENVPSLNWQKRDGQPFSCRREKASDRPILKSLFLDMKIDYAVSQSKNCEGGWGSVVKLRGMFNAALQQGKCRAGFVGVARHAASAPFDSGECGADPSTRKKEPAMSMRAPRLLSGS
jgi:hypothetical protein